MTCALPISLPLLGLLDSVLPNDMRPRSMRRGLLADLPVWLATLLAVGLYFMAAWWVRSADAITPLQYAGAVLSPACDRQWVVAGQRWSGRVVPGGGRIIKKKEKNHP